MFYEANRDGTISEGNSFTGFDPQAELITFFERLGWNATIQKKGKGGYFHLDLSFEDIHYDAHIYLKTLTPGGGPRNSKEKRAQFPGDLDRTGYDAASGANTLKAILCIYGNSDYPERIICGWNIDEWGHNPGKAFNCYIDIDAVADAFVFGMTKHTSSKGQIAYAFKPEFLIYYLFNSTKLYAPSANEPIIEVPQIAVPLPDIPRNRILFGPPGTGKSSKIKTDYANPDTYPGLKLSRVTFHPDYEYGAFVGSYKPISEEVGGKKEIHYKYVAQEFIKAYTNAWNDPKHPHFLIIEEINRGNCAQIFGDLFQSLDRNADNFSEYEVDTDTDLATYLIRFFADHSDAATLLNDQLVKHGCWPGEFSKIILPDNLYLYATMNTSDQSLFPMDSAFKRRWDWEYVPIEYKPRDRKTGEVIDYVIDLDGVGTYSWSGFIEKVNKHIYDATQSEDKQLGFWFIKPSSGKGISKADFKAKVLFYLWFEVFRNEPTKSIFPATVPVGVPTDTESFVYGHLFNPDYETAILQSIMQTLQLELIPPVE